MKYPNENLLCLRHRVLPRVMTVFIALLAALSLTAAINPAAAADLSATERFIQAGQSLIPQLDQFRLTLKGTYEGRQTINAVIGWSKGSLVSASITTPAQGKKPVEYGLRPSGFMLKSFDGKQEIQTDLVKHADIFPMAARIINRDVWSQILGILGAEANISGTKKVSGRNTLIMQSHASGDTYKKVAQAIAIKIKEDPGAAAFFAWLGEYKDISADEAATWLTDLLVKTALLIDSTTLPPTPMYIEDLNGTPIGVDTTGWTKWWSGISSKMEPKLYQPKFSMYGVKADRTGKITAISFRFVNTTHLPINLRAVEQQVRPLTPRDVEALSKAKRIDTYDINMSRIGNSLLPTVIAKETSYDLGPEWGIIPGQDKVITRYTLSWDLAKGADTKLTEAPALLEVERTWQAAQAAVKSGDRAATVMELERVLRLIPSFKEAYRLLADTYKGSGELDKYTQTLVRMLQIDPNNAAAISELAYTLVDKKIDVVQGLAMARKAYDLDLVDAGVAHTLGWAYYRNGLLEDAEKTLRYAIDVYKVDPDAAVGGLYHYHLAVVLFEQGKLADALAALDEALDAQPGMSEAVELRAKVKRALDAQG